MDQHPRPPLTRRLTFRHLVAADGVFAVAVVALDQPSTSQLGRLGVPLPIFLAVSMLLMAGVAVRRVWPLPALALSCSGALLMGLLGFTKFPGIALTLVLYVVALVRPTRFGLVALVCCELTTVASSVIEANRLPAPFNITDFGTFILAQSSVLLASWAIGFALRQQRVYAEALQEQAERRAQTRIDQAERTVTEERLRIARELHDAVAHSMSVIAVQAGVGHHVIATRPDEAAKALAAIETTSRATLREMRALLGVLREEDDAGEFLAAPGLADLPSLVKKTGRAGLRVDLQVKGAPREVPQGIGLAAYRIVQEALTNVVKHARTGHARIMIIYAADEVEVEVTDDGIGKQPPGDGGHGLIGMRERVALYGGRFSAGPLPLGGFRVAATLPLGDPQ